MVYKKYIKRGGKKFGPYYYKSHKVKGRVITEYLGKSDGKNKFFNKSFFAIGFGVVFILAVIFFVGFNLTGNISLDVKSKYNFGELLKGDLKVKIQAGELVPKDSIVFVGLGNLSKEFFLYELVDENLTDGNFYVEDSEIFGSGKGYGVIGSKKIYPEIDFDLLISEKSEKQKEVEESKKVDDNSIIKKDEVVVDEKGSEFEEKVSEDSVKDKESEDVKEKKIAGVVKPKVKELDEDIEEIEEEDEVEEVVEEEEEIVEEIDDEEVEEEVEEIPEDIEESSSEESSSEESSAGITGAVVESDVVSGVVSKGNDFIYNLEKGETAMIIHGSVEIDGEEISEDNLKLKNKKDKVVVSTNYFVEEDGFGKEYLGKNKLNLKIPLEDFGFIVENSSVLIVKIIYDNKILVEAEKDISVVGNVSEEIIVNETVEEIIIEKNITIINQTISNETIVNQTVDENNLTIITSQFNAVINKPVKWKKKVSIDEPSNIILELPKESTNISVFIVEENVNETILEVNETGINETIFNEPKKIDKKKVKITAKVVSGEVSAEIDLKDDSLIIDFFKKLFGFMTGKIIDVEEQEDLINVVIDENATEFEIEYNTPAPVAFETDTFYGKEIVVSSDVHCENILAYTDLPREVSESSVKLYHIINGTRVEVSVDKYDLNNNSLIDYIEWVVPHLSNQSYQLVIEIVKAEHLDSNRSFIADVFDLVKEKDNVWFDNISSGEYLRVSFEQELDSSRDITLYARSRCFNGIGFVLINNTNVSCEIYQKKKRIDEIRRLLE